MNSVEPFSNTEPLLVAVIRDRNPMDVLHGEVETTLRRRPCVVDTGDVRVVHQRQRLALGLEAANDLPRVHPGFDDLESHLPADRLALLRQPHLAHPARADPLQQTIRSDLAGRYRAHAGSRGVAQVWLEIPLAGGRCVHEASLSARDTVILLNRRRVRR